MAVASVASDAATEVLMPGSDDEAIAAFGDASRPSDSTLAVYEMSLEEPSGSVIGSGSRPRSLQP